MSDIIGTEHGRSDKCYLFAKKLQFTANENLAVERSDIIHKPKWIQDMDIWRKLPPDFSVKLYKSSDFNKNTFDLESGDIKGGRRKDTFLQVSKQPWVLERKREDHFPLLVPKEEPIKFLTRFKALGPLEASTLFVKNGVYPKDRYKDPKPHDFRQYDAGIPDFHTAYPRDPLNLKLKSQHLSYVHGLRPLQEKSLPVKGFVTHQPAALPWDSNLILPKNPFPPKSASFTRHRRRRGVYSAFMDRVEEKFSASNQKQSE
ncbi:uncharacterized protein LOC108718852 [Xenopus laevis]|uniref:Uncharacterized protein n=2 Tax=Xenopus laevis TaxID=8355 RepID=A0A974HF88_XENLA|nr:uncharacterized protein LOC108718852 [Xenopus laevis]OCT75723.1 hypothetical protein XELAEV_18030910mg [Xenopus laevis]